MKTRFLDTSDKVLLLHNVKSIDDVSLGNDCFNFSGLESFLEILEAFFPYLEQSHVVIITSRFSDGELILKL